MAFDPEPACRVAFGLLIVATMSIGLPFRMRADRAGGRVSVREDPRWFWILMSIVGPPVVLTCIAFLVHPRWIDFVYWALNNKLAGRMQTRAAVDRAADTRVAGVKPDAKTDATQRAR